MDFQAPIAFGLFAGVDAASGASTSLDPLESTTPTANPPRDCLDDDAPIWENIPFRHSCWQADRLRVHDALERAGARAARRSAFVRCGRCYWVMQNRDDPNVYRTVPETCHDRFCNPCGNDRASRIKRNLHTYLDDRPHRFLTLTIRHSDEPLTEVLDRLLLSFRVLRKTKFWRTRVSAGAAFLEVTFNPESRFWHPHLHVIIAGKYLPKDRLVNTWKRITGGSFQVHIRFIKDRDDTIRYVAKYATKPLHPSILADPDALRQAITALTGRKTLYCFGKWAKWKLLADPDADSWTVFAAGAELRYRASTGDELCQRILQALVEHPGEDVRVSGTPP